MESVESTSRELRFKLTSLISLLHTVNDSAGPNKYQSINMELQRFQPAIEGVGTWMIAYERERAEWIEYAKGNKPSDD